MFKETSKTERENGPKLSDALNFQQILYIFSCCPTSVCLVNVSTSMQNIWDVWQKEDK